MLVSLVKANMFLDLSVYFFQLNSIQQFMKVLLCIVLRVGVLADRTFLSRYPSSKKTNA